MTRIVILTSLLLALTASAEPPTSSGELKCDRAAKSSECRLTWNMTDTARAYYQLQTYSTKHDGWKKVGKPRTNGYTTLNRTVRGGRLYRVVACDDKAVSENCASSTVHWVLAKPPTDRIPDTVIDKSGTAMTVSKDEDRWSQLDQYNVYLLVQLVEQIDDLASMPAMTRPGIATDSPVVDESLTNDEQIYGSIYHNYEAMRMQAKTKS